MLYKNRTAGITLWMWWNNIKARHWAWVQEELPGEQVVEEEFRIGFPGEIGILEKRVSQVDDKQAWSSKSFMWKEALGGR